MVIISGHYFHITYNFVLILYLPTHRKWISTRTVWSPWMNLLHAVATMRPFRGRSMCLTLPSDTNRPTILPVPLAEFSSLCQLLWTMHWWVRRAVRIDRVSAQKNALYADKLHNLRLMYNNNGTVGLFTIINSSKLL